MHTARIVDNHGMTSDLPANDLHELTDDAIAWCEPGIGASLRVTSTESGESAEFEVYAGQPPADLYAALVETVPYL